MIGNPESDKKLFFARTIGYRKADLEEIKNKGTYKIWNDLDKGGYQHHIRMLGLGEDPVREFSVPTGSVPVYPYIGTWEELEIKVSQRFSSEYPHHVIVGEVPIELINSRAVRLRVNAPFSLDPIKKMDAEVSVKDGKIVLAREETENIVPELRMRIEFGGKTPTLESRNGWFGEAYVIDSSNELALEKLPEVRIYQETPEGVVLKQHWREGRIMSTSEGAHRGPENKG